MSANPQSPPPGPRRRRRAAPGRAEPPKVDLSNFLDVHICVGLHDSLLRIDRRGWEKLLMHWMIAEETVILRSPRKDYEENIVLRGSDSGAVEIRPANPARRPPAAVVHTAVEMMEGINAESAGGDDAGEG